MLGYITLVNAKSKIAIIFVFFHVFKLLILVNNGKKLSLSNAPPNVNDGGPNEYFATTNSLPIISNKVLRPVANVNKFASPYFNINSLILLPLGIFDRLPSAVNNVDDVLYSSILPIELIYSSKFVFAPTKLFKLPKFDINVLFGE